VHLRILKGPGGPEVTPTFWSDSFLELLPWETQDATANYSRRDLGASPPVISVEGWNVSGKELAVGNQ
jgi:exo-1,4-beta-D-glucosaminidase